MNALICFFLLTLQDGETVRTYTRKEGENILVTCEFGLSGNRKLLCKEVCEEKNILIDTTEDRAWRDRYSIRYEKRGKLSSELVYVSIKELKQSDSGRYRCRSDKWTGSLYDDFELVVTEASTTTATPSSSSSETNKLSEKPAAASGLQLYVGLTLVAKIILLSTPLVIFCRKRRVTKTKDPAVKSEYAVVSHDQPREGGNQRGGQTQQIIC
ncbi:hypothetical protein ILYODFUR_025735 [Ilyodon furcidens]|uniref:Immunoglobulin subtype domain-containing protein n=1 Tax=Ilyodon furcidens TaxID=33524 RepID=A0ABV0U9S4_9TELE